MLTQRDCKMIAECFGDVLKNDTELQDVMATAMARTATQKEHLVKMSDAARILGISKSLLYRIKDHFSCVKTGEAKTARLLFKESTLLSEYEAYLAKK